MSERMTIDEMAEDLPEGSEDCTSPKAQMLLVATILRRFTDANNGLTADEIRAIIGRRTGKTPTASKVRDDIHTLVEAHAFGMDVYIPGRGESTGFRCRRTFLSSEQARLAINMVRTCKFVTRQQRDDVCEALYAMVSNYQEDRIAGSVAVDERELPANPDVFAVADVFSEAIRKGKAVRFRYAARGLDGEDHFYSSDSPDGKTFEESPISLVYSYGCYYAETWSYGPKGGNRTVRRLDRIRDAKVSDTETSDDPEIEELRRTVQDRTRQLFDMYGKGKVRDLFLKVSAKTARYVYDRFGHDIGFEHLAQDGSYGYAYIRIEPALTFYRWLFGMGNQITLARPLGSLWEEVFYTHGLDPRKGHQALVDDYEATVHGLRRQMEASAAAYGWMLNDAQ